jgi:DNA-binding transcriptional MerR regulator
MQQTAAPLLAADVARILGLTPSTVRLLANQGKLRHTRTPSGVRLFDPADVEQLRVSRARR